MGRLKNKVAVVTGAGNGIGRCIAELFAREGAAVVIVDIAEQDGCDAVEVIVGQGGRARFIRTDVTSPDEIRSMLARSIEMFGRIDILVNNAACWGRDTTIVDVPEEVWDQVLDGSLKSVYLTCKYAIPELQRAGGGVIVNISSVNAVYGVGLTAYSAAKAGIIGLTRLVAVEYGREKIRANVILPGTIGTAASLAVWKANGDALEEITKAYPVGRIGEPPDIAYCALYLASDESAFVTGGVFVVDGGLTAGRDFGF